MADEPASEAPIDAANPMKMDGGMDMPPVDAEGLPINPDGQEVKSNIPPETLEDMKALWDVFDMEATNNVPIKELRTIMRALDIDLDPEALELVR